MVKYGIFYEQDEHGEDTGRVQVAEEEADYVLDTFDTEEEAEKYRKELQVESDRDDKIKTEYLEWEKACMARHQIKQKELREYLVNMVCI